MRRDSKEYRQAKACWELRRLEGWEHIKDLIEAKYNVTSINTLDDAFKAAGSLEKNNYSRSIVATIERLSEKFVNSPIRS